MNAAIIYLQLVSALILLSDAYLTENYREKIDLRLKKITGNYAEIYRSKYLKRDLAFFVVTIGGWFAFWLFGKSSHVLASFNSIVYETLGFSYTSLILVTLWFFGMLYFLSIALSGLEHLDKFFHLLISFPLAYALYRAPKGPFYAIGFGLLVVSHLLQLVVTYKI